MWIRSPTYDAFWILSGVPIALILTVVPPILNIPPTFFSIYAVVLLDMGHNLSSLALAWGHSEFRPVMLRHKAKFIALPLALVGLSLAVGFASQAWYPEVTPFMDSNLNIGLAIQAFFYAPGDPVIWLLFAYLLWNAYHFGMQNFGVMSIYRFKSGRKYGPEQRWIDMVFCLVVQAAVIGILFSQILGPGWLYLMHIGYLALSVAAIGMLLREAALTGLWWSPRILFAMGHTLSLTLWPGVWIIGINGINHWLTAIGLSSHIYGTHKNKSPAIFAAVVTIAGILLFIFMFWNGEQSWNLRDDIKYLLPYLSFRLGGLGFTHFLYDRWLYKFSNPEVRATIGRDLFLTPPAAGGAAPLAAQASLPIPWAKAR